jgi:cysteine desulfuration protein SufE
MTVQERQAALVGEWSFIEDVQERLSAIVASYGDQSFADEHRIATCEVKGCVSRVWLRSWMDGGCCRFQADAESPMVKGLVRLLCAVYDGGQPQEVVTTELDLWQPLGFHRLLSPTRVNGLAAMRESIRQFAVSHASV